MSDHTSTAIGNIAVIIPAYRSEATIGAAVSSALSQEGVHEVVVVDDASGDGTVEAAKAADDGTGRLAVHRMAKNSGPSAARNVAIEQSRSEVIALLDADDRFLPGRMERLMAVPQWDLIADDVLFAGEDDVAAAAPIMPDSAREPAVETIDLTAFVLGNVTRPGLRRRELGFLHPMMRRSFLTRHGLRYDNALRLGEDYDLYTRAFIAGARFKLVSAVGYFAIERMGSLSGAHRTDDLERLREVDHRLLECGKLTQCERTAIRQHAASVTARYELRRFLDTKNKGGLFAASSDLLRRPYAAPAVVIGIARDKLRAARGGSAARDSRPTTLLGSATS